MRSSDATRLLLLVLALLVTACGDLPQPFRNRPGGDALRLALPLAVRLAVPPPQAALLPDAAAMVFAEKLAEALQTQDVPAVATATPWPLDWRVDVVADRQGASVVPRFRLLDGDGRAQASTDGGPVPLAAWAEADAALLGRVATAAAPGLARLLLQVDAARKSVSPEQLTAGPPRIRMGQVRGAPGDGNTALAARMREHLGGQGFLVQDSADGALYGLDATVAMVAASPGVQRVELIWKVSRRDGEELGQIAQLNEVRAGSLDRFWGDVAYVAAEQAADGVRTVIANAAAPDPRPPLRR